jgi:hypothetical protein
LSGSCSARTSVQIPIFKLLFIVLDDSRYTIDVCHDRRAEDTGQEAEGRGESVFSAMS